METSVNGYTYYFKPNQEQFEEEYFEKLLEILSQPEGWTATFFK